MIEPASITGSIRPVVRAARPVQPTLRGRAVEAEPSRHHNSVFRGIEALTTLLHARHSLGVTQLAAAMKLSKSTAHDLVAALCALGFVDQNPRTRRYSVSPEIFRFLHLFSTEYGPNSAIRPWLRARARRHKATLIVTALSRRSTYALCASGPEADTFLLGDTGPAFDSACGKILVAQHDESEWPGFAPEPGEEGNSPFVHPDAERFYAELRAARQTGIAWSLRERDPGLCSVAAPLCVGEKPWPYAIGLALRYDEWLLRDRSELADEVKGLAGELVECWTKRCRVPASMR